MQAENVTHQALYRRFRPQRFGDLVGQQHVSDPLRSAVRDGRVAHAYLFSGPRGTGKTTTARILAMALNCKSPNDGEPCGECESCVAIRTGTSVDVIELDAASNRKLDDIREIIRAAALSTAGDWRVFILDEVHQLDRHAVPALLKTLEEPPAHVVFVLATTDPQEVLPTIRSRTQHYEFRLLPHDVLRKLVDDTCAAASIELDDASKEAVVRRGRGSARDTLSALDQAAALGKVGEDDTSYALAIAQATAVGNSGAALAAASDAFASGRTPRALGEELIRVLRNALLVAVAPSSADVASDDRELYADIAEHAGLSNITKGIDATGVALAEMRDAFDARIPLEVAIVRMSMKAELGAPATQSETPSVQSATPGKATSTLQDVRAQIPENISGSSEPATDRPAPQALGAVRKTIKPVQKEAVKIDPPPAPAAAMKPAIGSVPSRETLTIAWGDSILAALDSRSRARFRPGRWVSVEGDVATFALPDNFVKPAIDQSDDVAKALSDYFGVPIKVSVVEDAVSHVETKSEEPSITRDELEELPKVAEKLSSPEELLKRAFPGAKEVDQS